MHFASTSSCTWADVNVVKCLPEELLRRRANSRNSGLQVYLMWVSGEVNIQSNRNTCKNFTPRCEFNVWISVLKRSNECDSVENSQGQSKTTEVANSVIAEGTFSVVHMQTA